MCFYAKQVNWLKSNYVLKLKQNKIASAEAGNAICIFCAGQATKIVWVDCSAEPLVAHWYEEMANKPWKKEHVQACLKLKIIKSQLAKMSCAFKSKRSGRWLGRYCDQEIVQQPGD